MHLSEELKHLTNWKHQPLRRVFIPKPNGTFRSLDISTIKDRTIQCLLKYALNSFYEAYASKVSWGFRPGRCIHDVQKIVFNNLN